MARKIKAEGSRSARWHIIKLKVAGREDKEASEQSSGSEGVSKRCRWLKEEHLRQPQ